VEEQNWEPMVAVANPFVSGHLSVPPAVLLFDVSTAALPAASSAPWLWSKRVGANFSIQLHTVGINNQLSDWFKVFFWQWWMFEAAGSANNKTITNVSTSSTELHKVNNVNKHCYPHWLLGAP
jgi:hypothetical protein